MGATACPGPGQPAQCVPPMEVCGNNRDDNCDGRTDENCCTAGTPCTTTCMSTGTTTCTAGMPARCTPPAEVCGNNRDDDCDAMIDEGCCTSGVPCTTTCATQGMLSCATMGMLARCVPPAEACNGRDDDCDGMIDNGFMCVPGTSTACTTTCGSASTRTCSAACAPGACTPPAERCNGRDDDCDGTADNGFACVSGAMGNCPTACGSTGRRTCTGACAWDTCVPPAEVCNGVDDNCNATCDEGFTCCARSTRACSALGMGFVSGNATCRADCGGWDTSGCGSCGNNVRNAPEQCDGPDLNSATCASLMLGAGALRCAANCTYDISGCSSCGNGRVDASEQCDGAMLNGGTCASQGMGFTGGTLSCANCRYVTTACTRAFDPSGSWVFAPPVSYTCAIGFVNFNFGALQFADGGTALVVSGGGLNCTMTGASARATRMVNVTCFLPGSCAERYTLTGTFTTDNVFMGSFTAMFTGGTSCLGCSTRTITANATR